MTTTSITHHRPAPFIAAAAAVTALAAGSVVLALSQDDGRPSAPGEQSHSSVQQQAPRTHHFHPTTSGGRVMIAP